MLKHKNSHTWLKIGVSLVAACSLSNIALAQKLAWGSFKDNGCLGKSGQRVYSSVLWNIPKGKDWIAVCMRTPALVTLRNGNHIRFPNPTTCTKSTINEALGVASLVAGAPGLVYAPVGAFSLVLGAGSYAMEKAGIGAINVWGLFQMVDPSCPGKHAAGYIQTIPLVVASLSPSLLEQSFVPNTLKPGSGKVRVCFINYGKRQRWVTHDGPGVGPYNRIGTLGGSQCGNFPASARVTFKLFDGGVLAKPQRALTVSLHRYENGTMTFAWKD